MLKQKKAAASLSVAKIIGIAIIAIVIVLVLLYMFRSGLPEQIRSFFPDFFPKDPPKTDYSLSSSCPFKIAEIIEGEGNFRHGPIKKYIYFCEDKDNCNDWTSATLYGNEIQIAKKQIGIITRGRIGIYPEIRNGVGSEEHEDLYFDLSENQKQMPTHEQFLNLHSSFFYTPSILCRVSKTTVAEERKEAATRSITIPAAFISSGKLYYNVDELIQNKGTRETTLYIDQNLNQQANSFIDKEWGIHMEAEEEQNINPGYTSSRNHIKPSQQDISNYFSEPDNGKETGQKQLTTPLNNDYNKLGTDSNGDDFEYVNYKKVNNKLYIKFYDYTMDNTETPWILLDYWNAYQNFARVPGWAQP